MSFRKIYFLLVNRMVVFRNTFSPKNAILYHRFVRTWRRIELLNYLT